jgi:hypothetical protein
VADHGDNARPLDASWTLRRAAAVWATNQPGQLGSRTTGTGPATAATVSCRCYSAVQLTPRRTAVVCWIRRVRGEGNGTTEGEVCRVGLVRKCGWECCLGVEVAWWSAYVQVDACEKLGMGVEGSGDQRSVNDARSVSEEHLTERDESI